VLEIVSTCRSQSRSSFTSCTMCCEHQPASLRSFGSFLARARLCAPNRAEEVAARWGRLQARAVSPPAMQHQIGEEHDSGSRGPQESGCRCAMIPRHRVTSEPACCDGVTASASRPDRPFDGERMRGTAAPLWADRRRDIRARTCSRTGLCRVLGSRGAAIVLLLFTFSCGSWTQAARRRDSIDTIAVSDLADKLASVIKETACETLRTGVGCTQPGLQDRLDDLQREQGVYREVKYDLHEELLLEQAKPKIQHIFHSTSELLKSLRDSYEMQVANRYRISSLTPRNRSELPEWDATHPRSPPPPPPTRQHRNNCCRSSFSHRSGACSPDHAWRAR